MEINAASINDIGAYLKAKREAAGLDVKTLAARSGLTKPGIYYVEDGRSIPRLSTLALYADALGLTIEIREAT